MLDLYNTGIRPAIDTHLLKEAEKVRDYGDYWSASSAGYCMRKLIFERLGVPPIKTDARKQRVFSSGHIFHSWIQELTKAAGLSIAQELELQDEDLMVRGHFDDLILFEFGDDKPMRHLILYDYKTQNSRAFSYKRPNMSHYHKMQLGTYMYMLRKANPTEQYWPTDGGKPELYEARILKISKDDLRISEEQLLWSNDLELEIRTYWDTLNNYWDKKYIPPCTCADHEGGFMAKEPYNPFYFGGEPCSLDYYLECKKLNLLKKGTQDV